MPTAIPCRQAVAYPHPEACAGLLLPGIAARFDPLQQEFARPTRMTPRSKRYRCRRTDGAPAQRVSQNRPSHYRRPQPNRAPQDKSGRGGNWRLLRLRDGRSRKPRDTRPLRRSAHDVADARRLEQATERRRFRDFPAGRERLVSCRSRTSLRFHAAEAPRKCERRGQWCARSSHATLPRTFPPARPAADNTVRRVWPAQGPFPPAGKATEPSDG